MKQWLLLILFAVTAIYGEEINYRHTLTFGYYATKAEAVRGAAHFSTLTPEEVTVEDLRFEQDGELFYVIAACITPERERTPLERIKEEVASSVAANARTLVSLAPPERVVVKRDVPPEELACNPITLLLPPSSRGKNWRVGAKQIFRKGVASTDCLPGNATTQAWDEKINVRFQSYENIRTAAVTARKLGDLFIRELKNTYSESDVTYTIHKKVHNEFIVEWKVIEEETPLYQILRIVTNKTGLYRIAYISKEPLALEERNDWIDAITTASLN